MHNFNNFTSLFDVTVWSSCNKNEHFNISIEKEIGNSFTVISN